MPLFSKDGKEFVQISDDADDLDLMYEAGYQPYLSFTKDKEEYVTMPAEQENVRQMNAAGYKTDQQWADEEQIRKTSKVQYSAAESFGQGAVEQLTFGFSDELAAALAKGSYGKNLEAQRYLQKEAERQHPTAKMAGEVTGAIATGFLAPGVGATKTVSQAVGKGMISGGIQNALQSYGESEATTAGGQLADVAKGAATGAVLGGIGGALTRPAEAAAKAGQVAEKVGEAAKPVTEAAGKAVDLGMSAFEAGKEEAGKYLPVGLIPKVGPAILSGIFTKGAVTDLVQNVKAGRQFSSFVKTLREELGESAGKLDDSTIFNSYLAQSGDNPAKRFLADLIGKERGLKPDDVTQLHKYLVESPELSKAARQASVVSRAKEVAKDIGDVATKAKLEAQRIFGQRAEETKQAFTSQDTGIQEQLIDAYKALKADGVTGEDLKAVERAFHRLHGNVTREGNKKLSDLKLQNRAAATWENLTPYEQASNYFKVKSVLDKQAKKRGDGEETLRALSASINDRLRQHKAKLEADAEYTAWSGLRTSVNNLFGKQFTPQKVAELAKDTDKAKWFISELDDLEENLTKAPFSDSQKKPILEAISKLQDFREALSGESAMVRTLNQLKALDENTLKRLDRIVGKGSLASETIRQPGQYTGARTALQQQLDELAQSTYQKPFNELSKLEQFRLVGQIKKGPKK